MLLKMWEETLVRWNQDVAWGGGRIDDKIDEGVGYEDYVITNVTSDDVCYQPELREKVGGCVCV